MKRIAALILTLSLASSALGQINTSSWDISSVIGYDAAKDEMVVAAADPVSNYTAMRVYRIMSGFIGALVEEHVQDDNGKCFVGHRTVVDGQSAMRYMPLPCHNYDGYRAVWRQAVDRVMQQIQTVPLESTIKKSQKP